MEDMKTFSWSLVIALLAFAQTRANTTPEYRVYYFNMFANTHVPITPKSIEEMYDLSSILRREMPEILTIFSQSTEESSGFDVALVKLKIIDSKGRVILVDLLGNVRDGRRSYRLSKDDHRRLHGTIMGAFPDDARMLRRE